MKQNYGHQVQLTYAEARQLEAQRHVRIIDADVPRKHIDNTSYMFRTRFARRKLTRVAWIQNYSKEGGAEISNFRAVRVGQKLGYDVVGCNIDIMNNIEHALRVCDVAIVNNMHSHNHDDAVKLILDSGKPFVIYSHDCYGKSQELFERAECCFFISPAHQRFYEDKFKMKRVERMPLAFDVDRWKFKHNGRVPNSVLVMAYEKSRNNLLKYIEENPNHEYYIANDIVPPGKNIHRLPKVFYNDAHELYPQYETVLHLPGTLCAGDRVLFEAIMCGCKVITNENAGHASWSEEFDWRDEKVLRPILAKAPYTFWRIVDDVLLSQRKGVAA